MSFESMNDAFSQQYGRTRDEKTKMVLVVLGEELVVCRDGSRDRMPIRPPAFHDLKALAHAPLAAFLALRSKDEKRISDVRKRIASVEEEHPLRTLALDALDGTIGIEEMGRRATPHLLETTEEATKMHLDALHEQTEAALAKMSPDERDSFYVVVTGDHQARQRSVAMQYFRNRLAEPEGREDRVLYAESVEDVDGAIALVGTNRLDRELARLFFDDERRLQRDVLGDAAKKLLDAARYPSI